ncbi:MAG: zf-HC2 domain-containing protein [Anaerolineae bacterium]|jgi:predicted anti-sigma-YlaC factor YlaD|nr:zf-HC2 domain-containing protein [Anaerolineae bacterium]MBT7075791.1 zf-HC2 domain-containing protein [Anaerolineae bacterium]MBT7781741.1 zf-HC2 domain-containing protein [Anaerolineae bacterium]
MAKHILDSLGAYLDGELRGRELKKVETHLSKCELCAEEYASLKSLSEILEEAPLPDFSSPDRFAADVVLRLPRKEMTSIRSKVLEVGWWLAPVGLIAIWVFLGITNLLNDTLLIANEFGFLNSTATSLISSANPDAIWSARLGNFGFLAGNNLQWARTVEAFTRTTASHILWQLSIAVLYLIWIAVSWVRHEHRGFGKSIEG